MLCLIVAPEFALLWELSYFSESQSWTRWQNFHKQHGIHLLKQIIQCIQLSKLRNRSLKQSSSMSINGLCPLRRKLCAEMVSDKMNEDVYNERQDSATHEQWWRWWWVWNVNFSDMQGKVNLIQLEGSWNFRASMGEYSVYRSVWEKTTEYAKNNCL